MGAHAVLCNQPLDGTLECITAEAAGQSVFLRISLILDQAIQIRIFTNVSRCKSFVYRRQARPSRFGLGDPEPLRLTPPATGVHIAFGGAPGMPVRIGHLRLLVWFQFAEAHSQLTAFGGCKPLIDAEDGHGQQEAERQHQDKRSQAGK